MYLNSLPASKMATSYIYISCIIYTLSIYTVFPCIPDWLHRSMNYTSRFVLSFIILLFPVFCYLFFKIFFSLFSRLTTSGVAMAPPRTRIGHLYLVCAAAAFTTAVRGCGSPGEHAHCINSRQAERPSSAARVVHSRVGGSSVG